MPEIVCQVETQPDQVTFTWSQGKDYFDPYALTGSLVREFDDRARTARERLADLVVAYHEAGAAGAQDEQRADVRRAAHDLAVAGHAFFKALFNPGKADNSKDRLAREVKKWLLDLLKNPEGVRLEIVHKGTRPVHVPWNVVYDTKPDERAFQNLSDDRVYQPFWGVRFDLTGGPRIDPTRRLPWWTAKPRLWMLVDPDIHKGLPSEQQQALHAFRQKHAPVWIEEASQIEKELKHGPPDLMYWLCHADPSALYLGGDPISPDRLRELLEASDDEDDDRTKERPAGLAFLNACRTAEAGTEGSFLETFHKLGMCGLVATEHQTIDTFASPVGLEFLEAFLERGEEVGTALHRLRRHVPLGLLYAAYCPPNIRLVSEETAKARIEVTTVAPQGGALMGTRTAPPRAELPPLPDRPYRSLQFYDGADRALFTGRDGDVRRFCRLLDAASTRLLVLHGESGVGKSSFLRAGVIPYLEEEGVGYRFLRDRSAKGDDGPVLFLRATNDLAGQLAGALTQFCARPFTGKTPAGKALKVDLPVLLSRHVGGKTDPASVRAVLAADPGLLGRLLAALAAALPFGVVLVIDQGEEIFTLAREEKDAPNRKLALDLLRQSLAVRGDFKVIVGLRTEYYGRLADRLRRGLGDAEGVREYLLTDFSEVTLAEAIRQPTLDHSIPYAKEVPFQKYGFRYADGLPELLAGELIGYTTNRLDSTLPLVQVVCSQLAERAQARPDRVVTTEDLKALGGLKGGMRRHVLTLVSRLFPDRKDRKAFQRLLTRLYLRQPDGTLTTALLPTDDAENEWQGKMLFDEVLAQAESGEWRLLRVTSLRLGGEAERGYVSLGHDALAQVAAEWDDELKRGARLRKLVAGVMAMAVLALVLTGLTVWAWIERDKAHKNAQLAEKAEVKAKDEAKHATDEEAKAKRAEEMARLEEAKAKRELTRAEDLVYVGNLLQAHLLWAAGNSAEARDRLDACRWDNRGWEHAHLRRQVSSNWRRR